MKTNSYFSGKIKEKFEKFFDKNMLTRLGKTSGFVQRSSKKITPFAFVAAFIDCCTKRTYSFSAWAAAIGVITAKTVSKQALFERLNDRAVKLAKEAFSHVLAKRLKAVAASGLFTHFKRVLLQDSTTLSLPDSLAMHFPGNMSLGVQKAVARLQCVLNLSNMQWLKLELKAYTDNDQGASSEVLPLLRKDDLLIRDLGYFVLGTLQQIIDCKAFFISRLKYNVQLFDAQGEALDWKKLVRKKKVVEQWVWIGKEARVKARVIFVPLPAAVVAERVRKAKADRDKRLNHSPDYYRWIAYNVFITNAEEQHVGTEQVAEIYKVRWQVEQMFKMWKSGFGMQQMLSSEKAENIYRVKSSIYMLLLLICLVMQQVYYRCVGRVKKAYGRAISVIKLAAYVMNHLTTIICLTTQQLTRQVAAHCCYENRKDRINMNDLINNLYPLP